MLILEELERRFPGYEIIKKADDLIERFNSSSNDHIHSMLSLQEKLVKKKSCDKLFLKTNVSYFFYNNNHCSSFAKYAIL